MQTADLTGCSLVRLTNSTSFFLDKREVHGLADFFGEELAGALNEIGADEFAMGALGFFEFWEGQLDSLKRHGEQQKGAHSKHEDHSPVMRHLPQSLGVNSASLGTSAVMAVALLDQ